MNMRKSNSWLARAFPLARVTALVSALVSAMALTSAFAQNKFQTIAVESTGSESSAPLVVDAVVESTRTSTLAAQVSGAVIRIPVKAGDLVHAGQVLLQLDHRNADQDIKASNAQWMAAKTQMDLAMNDLNRKKQLLEKEYISRSAYEKSQMQYEAAEAQAKQLEAQGVISRNNANFYVLTAPYDAVVSEVNVSQGDLATPGRPLLSLYDPKTLRLSAAVAQSLHSRVTPQTRVDFEIPNTPDRLGPQSVKTLQWIPNVDKETHNIEIRIALPSSIKGLVPGVYARILFSGLSAGLTPEHEHLWIPKTAVLRHSEMVGVYVLSNPLAPPTPLSPHPPQLRQIRTGEVQGERIEVLSGLSKGDLVLLDPQLANRNR